ncbi:MAG: site-specific integrase [Acidobacteria bacterium]|nr:site-specific integrase [Acidobacteriota bacterium]
MKARKKPYYRTIDPGRHLGYYRGARGGKWSARFYAGSGRYLENHLGIADDTQDADGLKVLTFGQAQEKARKWFRQQTRAKEGLAPERKGPYTVKEALDEYLAAFTGTELGRAAATSASNAHILPPLGTLEVEKLTAGPLKAWHRGLACSPARLRTTPGAEQRFRKLDAQDPEAIRRRRATANRVLTILKAALNHAKAEHGLGSDDAWRSVKPFRKVNAPVIRYLTAAECQRLVNRCAPQFRRLVQAALLTGCRYGELVRLRVSDFNPEAATLAVRVSKAGEARHVYLTEEGVEFFEAATAGKASGDLMFTDSKGRRWGKSRQRRPLLEACEQAKIEPAVSFHILRHTHAAQLAMSGTPLGVISEQLGHADVRMTQRHYAHLSPSFVSQTIRSNFPTLGILENSTVRPLRKRDAKR